MEGVKVNDVSSWLFRVAVNKYKNFNKRKKIINTVSINEESFYEQIAQEFTVEGEILSKEISAEIRGTLNGLKEEYRSLLILKYDMELSYKEIGLLLGINEDSVKTYLYRARNKFKEEWRKNNERYG